MVEFNLLPDIKLAYIKTKRLKRTIISSCIILSSVFLGLFVLIFVIVNVVQRYQIDSLNTEITRDTKIIKNNPNLNKILTVQNQLNSLPNIESQVPASSRIFNYMSQLTPANATISDLNIDYSSNSMTITGGADSLTTVNQFIDTLKFTTYKTSATGKNSTPFSSIVLSSFSYSSSSSSTSPASYSLTLNFDPTIFNNSDNVTLNVPNIVTTRSILNQPTNLFKANTKG